METRIMNEKDLKSLSERYWMENWCPEKYIDKLLIKEINFLKEEKRIQDKGKKTDVLVQSVGYSWEPLLISICAYKPEYLVLILNRFYGIHKGNAKGEKYKELLKKLKNKNLIDNVPKILPEEYELIVEDSPNEVFKFLKRHVLPRINQGKEVIIDITGAKKSMVSGAYLFASYTNSIVTYVDYDTYNQEYGKPYGYTCKIGELKNPLELFKLREWDNVKQLYEKCSFRAARDLVNDIKPVASNFLDEEEVKSIEKLINWLNFYILWDDGDFKEAWIEFNKKINTNQSKSAPFPSAVKMLKDIWPDKNNLMDGIKSLEGEGDIDKSFYLKEKEFRVYAHDELEKIKRIIESREDHRSALLRAAGLNELLFRARIIKLWKDNEFVFEKGGETLTREDIDSNNKQKIEKKLVNSHGIHLIKSLRWEKNCKEKDNSLKLYGLEELGDPIKLHRSDDAPILDKFWSEITKIKSPHDLFEYRNKAIHFCLTIPKKEADAAVTMAEKNLEDFEKNWVTTGDDCNYSYDAKKWNDLCDVCGIKFLPRQWRDSYE
ncbi:MAG: hypothetical protein SWO11_17735 [Thermodesulfobacteriota bacterium]|nr:hypothetical protein [Thermodesulfobacteriota bacterium]